MSPMKTRIPGSPPAPTPSRPTKCRRRMLSHVREKDGEAKIPTIGSSGLPVIMPARRRSPDECRNTLYKLAILK